jgi:hypothetical protein
MSITGTDLSMRIGRNANAFYWYSINGNISTSQTISDWKNWHLYTVRLSGTGARFFRDGVQVDYDLSVNLLTSNVSSILIGRYGTYYWDGEISSVRIDTRSLDLSEIVNYYNGLPIDDSSLVGRWEINEGAGTTTYDSSGNGNTGTIIGAIWKTRSTTSFTKALHLITSVGEYTLTGINTILSRGWGMVCNLGQYTLTGIDVMFARGWGLVTSVGEYILTGKNSYMYKGWGIVCALGEYTLTGIDITINKALYLTTIVGNFILTGFNIIIHGRGDWTWSNITKHLSNWTNNTKHTSIWTNRDKSK